ncbi:MAG TPA: 50S ribosomal protein L21 [Candidatus Dormibacteraeota bacterium]|nr:50S ribosomal protein L21 [Candidatus Dormibacteraeota bacterium]
MYAIVQQGGRQYRVTPGDTVVVDRLPDAPGSTVTLEDVRMVAGGEPSDTVVGTPSVPGVVVEATVVGHHRGPKLLIFKYKPKKRYRRRHGFRAELTELRIESVGAPAPRRRAAAAAAEAVVAPSPAPVGETGEPKPPARRRAATPATKAAVAPTPAAVGEAGEPKPPARRRAAPKKADDGT